ncbi:hypothetical protein [Kitasatospora sp. NPDC097643]|uniref:hypothetical protein n=1 Tax=Kitasatospora sp. NPDC097643 TaxID=3157230 RepID=UPI00331DE3F6
MNDSPTVGATVHLVAPDGGTGTALASGFLTGPTTVLVPDPPRMLADPWARYAVRIAAGGDVESVRVAGVSLAAAAVDGIRTAAAVLALVGPSRHAGDAAVAITLDALTDSLRRHRGDLWAAYAELGYPVAPPAGSAPSPADLAPAWWLSLAGDDLSTFAQGICCVTINCGGCPKK